MKKLIAMILVVALVASSFCLEAFAASHYPPDFDEGTVNGKHWIARLSSDEITASSVLSWSSNGSVNVYMSGIYDNGWDKRISFSKSSSINGRPAIFNVSNPLIQCIWSVSSTCKIQGKVVSSLSTHY